MEEMDKKSVLDVQFIYPNEPPPYTLEQVPANPMRQPQYNTFSHLPPKNQSHSVPPQIAPTATLTQDGRFKRHLENMPQTYSVGAAVLIISSGGMNIACANGYRSSYSSENAVFWFVTAILGALLGATFTNKYPKKYFMFISSLLVLVGGVIVTFNSWDDASCLWARLLNGLAVGLVLVPTLVMSSEVSVKERRGMLACTVESLAFSIGIFLQILCYSLFSDSYNAFNSTQMHGIICILIGITSLIFACLVVIESPVYHLLHDQETEAIECLRRLQHPGVVTTETYALLEEHKHYIAENKELSRTQAFKDSLPALIRLCIYRGLVAMSCSIYINNSIMIGAQSSLGYDDVWAHIVYGLMRLIGVFVGVFTLDTMGRKKTLLYSLLPCAAMAIGVGAMFSDWHMIEDNITVIILIFIFQLFAGIVATSSSAYLSEGFPMAVKSQCICIVFVFEMVMHSIMILPFDSDAIAVFCIILGTFLLLFFVFTLKCLPETKNTTLREAQTKFKGYLSKGF